MSFLAKVRDGPGKSSITNHFFMYSKFTFAFRLFLLSLVSISANSQSFQWAGKYGGNGEDVVAAMYTDGSGNTYSTGYFTLNCDFDISEETSIISTGIDYEIFVAKTDENGQFAWAKAMGGLSGENGTAITADADGNVYVTGVYQETADFDPGAATFNLTSSGGLDIFVVKLDADGNFVWARSFGGEDYEQTTGIAVDSSGNVYLTGYFYAAADFDPSAAEFEMTPFGSGDGFAVKLDSSGDFLWAKQFGGTGFDLATTMEMTADGIYISGNFAGNADFNPSDSETFNLTTSGDGVYILHLDTDGEFVNATKVCEANGNIYGLGLDIDSTGNAYVSGYFGGIIIFATDGGAPITYNSPNFYNGYVAKVAAGGQAVWAKYLDATAGSQAYDVAVNSENEVFTYGFYSGSITIDSFNLTQTSIVNAQQNYLAKYDSDGNAVAAFGFGGSNFVDTCTMGIDDTDDIYLSAAFENSIDINPLEEGMQNVTSTDFRDVFLIKMRNEILATPENPGISFTVSPNPTNDLININSTATLDGQEYSIFDMTGRKVASGSLSNQNQISLAEMAQGIYNIEMGNKTLRIIKQ